MCDILCVTNRKICSEDFFQRIEKIAQFAPCGIILREKDLTETEYMQMAEKVLNICRRNSVLCILHSFVNVAAVLKAEAIHLSIHTFIQMRPEDKAKFPIIGVSCHSADEAIWAEKKGCTYVTAGHVFETDCKKGVQPRGINFLKNVCESVSVPVFAIGGINGGNIDEVRTAGAKGACVMSGIMECLDMRTYFDSLRR